MMGIWICFNPKQLTGNQVVHSVERLLWDPILAARVFVILSWVIFFSILFEN